MNVAEQISVSPLDGKQYTLPASTDDQVSIDTFLDQHADKKVVVVQGLGFVGAVMSIVCANALTEEYAVIGVDLANEQNYWKIVSLNEGQFPIVADDPKIEQFYNQAMAKGNFLATYDPYAYSKADVIIIDINLDVQKAIEDYEVDLTPFKKAVETIGAHCKPDSLVLVETTVPPGTCEKIVKPLIDAQLEARQLATTDWCLGHSYERVMPGPNYIDSIQNFYRVFSGIDTRSELATEQFLKTVISIEKYPLTKLGNTNATEMAKVLENSYRAMNIAFMVEWSRFAEEAGVNLYEVVQAIRMRPTHKNMMLPGIGVGGYCLTKDPLLASWSRQQLFHGDKLAQSEKGVRINDLMPRYAFEYLSKITTELIGRRVLLLGVSYRQDVGDTRYSPVETFYNMLLDAGSEILLHDPHVNYWEEKEVQVSGEHIPLLGQGPDIIIISTGHSYYKEQHFVDDLMGMEPLIIYDTVGLYSEIELQTLSKKHKVKVLGRGDI